ncbi:MAG: hypothetical protein AAF216_09660 [Pseudomonadota bacterium]
MGDWPLKKRLKIAVLLVLASTVGMIVLWATGALDAMSAADHG